MILLDTHVLVWLQRELEEVIAGGRVGDPTL